ncbi:hypothetical protein ABK040_011195 [Willaertia magna]
MNREHGEYEASTRSVKGQLHNIKEKIQHPFRHDMSTNSTYESKEVKDLNHNANKLAGTTATTNLTTTTTYPTTTTNRRLL